MAHNFTRDAVTASLAIPQDPNPAFLTPCYRVSFIADLLRMQTKSGTGSVRTSSTKPLNPRRQIHQIPSNKRIIPLITSIHIRQIQQIKPAFFFYSCLWEYRKQPWFEPGGYFQEELRECLFHQRSVSVEYPGYCCSGRRLKETTECAAIQRTFEVLSRPFGTPRSSFYQIKLCRGGLRQFKGWGDLMWPVWHQSELGFRPRNCLNERNWHYSAFSLLHWAGTSSDMRTRR
jgi:hypothetical protein